MSFDLVLKPACEGCGSPSDLYGSNCKHKTLCPSCGRTMAENRARCNICGVPITKLIREYNVRASTSADKSYFIGRFCTGLPPFSKKKNAENKWTMQRDGLQGRQATIDALREKFKNKPWVLEDETGQHQYQGQLEGSQSATYYLLVLHGKEFVAIPAGSWYNFNKVAQYKQLTLEEAEEKMNKRKNNADGYERWMMKAATNGSAAFGEMKKSEGFGGGGGGLEVARPKKAKGEENGEQSDRGEEDEEEEESRKNRLGLNRKGAFDDNEDGGKWDDMDDDDIEKGDDWEHEEIFTDDDEAVGNDPEEREDLAPDVPAPPEDDDDDDDDEAEGEEGGLSKSGKELKKLLGKAAGLNESDAEEDDDEDEMDDETAMSPVLAPKLKDETTDNSPLKPSGSSRGTPSSSKSSKTKKKTGNDDGKPSTVSQAKKETKAASVKEEPSSSSKVNASSKGLSFTAARTGSSPATGPVTEDEIRSVLLAMAPLTTQDLVANFKGRIKSKEDKAAFAEILRRISKIQKTNGQNYVVLR
ncbi:Transcription initiation factor IIF subunit alpha [Apostasia shenzhenica]|uniref:Transcription initiation factor IIF subunit alpha n=1 Tax=Apostasia shenzhenica TaxID=1088818 RepID=A0A2I0AMF2_9ASPA|nr:Transcription initiation factor IIF subunit alpha [Apostasia shenzhenica]